MATKIALACMELSTVETVKFKSVVPVRGFPLILFGNCKAKLKIPPVPIVKLEATGEGFAPLIGDRNRLTCAPDGKPAALTLMIVPGGPLTGFSPTTGF